ncbi:MAG: D-alanyl-D-alanine carboxypeptidase [Pseudomonadota bacterium]
MSSLSAHAEITERIRALAPNGLVYVVGEDGEELVSQNVDAPFVPASVAKIVTAWLAMDVLGGNYRFTTRFYVGDARVLYVRGGGDPFLVSEELALIAPRILQVAGEEPFSAIRLDTRYFEANMRVPGIENDDESYNAPNAALAANFNTINAVREGSTVRSAEEQTPITPLAVSQFRARAPNGRSRISLAQEEPGLSARYVGELLAAFIAQSGGSVSGDIAVGPVPEGLEPIYIHRQSRPLSEIINAMMIGSNNYVANQLFLEAGARDQGAPASLEKSVSALNARLAELELTGAITIVEGSGISRQNNMTAQGLVALLNDFEPHMALMTRSRGGSRYKTGTLDDVSTLAGYANTKKSRHGALRHRPAWRKRKSAV